MLKTTERLAILLTLTFAVAALVSADASDRWILVTRTSFGPCYIDSQTIKWDGDFVKSWTKVVHDSGAYELTHYQFNSPDKKIRVIGYVSYDKSGNRLQSLDEPTAWDDVAPESLAELILEFLKQHKPKIDEKPL
jgi:hypothetical protein